MSLLYPYIVAILIMLACLGWGMGLCMLGQTALAGRPLLLLPVAFGLGSGLLSLAVFGLGLAGLLAPPVLPLLLGAGLLIGGNQIVHILSTTARQAFQGLQPMWRFSLAGTCLLLLAIFAIINLLTAAAPPLDIDALNYHLAVPHIYVLRQRIVPTPSIYLSTIPFNIEMLYLICLALGSPAAAQLLHVCFGLACTLVIVYLARSLYGLRTAVLAILLFYTLTDLSGETVLARVDVAVAFYALVTFLCVTLALREPHTRLWPILAGIFAGLTAGSKYTGLVLIPIAALLVLAFCRPWSRGVRAMLTVGGFAAVVAAPWYLRNLIWTGDPFFPFFTDLFGQGPLFDEQVRQIKQANWDYAPVPRTLLNFVLSPWLLTVQHGLFASGRIGPLFLAYIPIYLLLRRHRLGRVVPLLTFCLLWLPFWFWTSPLVRFLFAPLGLLSILVAQSLRLNLRLRFRRIWQAAVLLTLSVWLAFAFASNLHNHWTAIQVTLGIVPPDRLLAQSGIDGYSYDTIVYTNTYLHPRLLLLFGSHGLYIDSPFILAGDWAMQHRPIVEQCDMAAINDALEIDGVSQIMLRDNQDLQHSDPLEAALFRCFRAHPPSAVEYHNGGDTIYTVPLYPDM